MAEGLAGKKIAILATDGFEQAELMDPRKALDEAGATTQVISPKGGAIKGWKMKDWGDSVTVDKTLDQVKAAKPTLDFDPRYGTDSGTWTTAMFIETIYRDLGKKK